MSRRKRATRRRAGPAPRATPPRPKPRRGRWLWPVAAGIVLVGVIVNLVIVLATRQPRTEASSGTPASLEISLEQGQRLYDVNCAACHGTDGAGYALRGMAAPALDATEHAWHHPDDQILALLRGGGTLMPAVGAGWTHDDLASVLAYVKQWWTPDQRRAQQGTIGE